MLRAGLLEPYEMWGRTGRLMAQYHLTHRGEIIEDVALLLQRGHTLLTRRRQAMPAAGAPGGTRERLAHQGLWHFLSTQQQHQPNSSAHPFRFSQWGKT